MTLTEFLLARIAEDEARCADPHDWYHRNQRLLAECEAKRRIVEQYQIRLAQNGDEDDYEHRLVTMTCCEELEEVLALLASPYADHPDYREEWKP